MAKKGRKNDRDKFDFDDDQPDYEVDIRPCEIDECKEKIRHPDVMCPEHWSLNSDGFQIVIGEAVLAKDQKKLERLMKIANARIAKNKARRNARAERRRKEKES